MGQQELSRVIREASRWIFIVVLLELASSELVSGLDEEPIVEARIGTSPNTSVARECLKLVGESLIGSIRWRTIRETEMSLAGNQAHRIWADYEFLASNCLVELFLSDIIYHNRREQVDFLALSSELIELIEEKLGADLAELDGLKADSLRIGDSLASMRQQLGLRNSMRMLKRRDQQLRDLKLKLEIRAGHIQLEINSKLESCLLDSNKLLVDSFRSAGQHRGDPTWRLAMPIISDCKRRLEAEGIWTRVGELCRDLRAQISLQQLARIEPRARAN